jgi:hypothetical protein
MTVHPETQIVKKIVKIDLPIELGVGRQRQVFPRRLSGNPVVQESLIDLKCLFARSLLVPQKHHGLGRIQYSIGTLVVHLGLTTELCRNVELFGQL